MLLSALLLLSAGFTCAATACNGNAPKFSRTSVAEEIILNVREVLADASDAGLKSCDMAKGRKIGDLVIKLDGQEYSVEELSEPLRNQVVNQPDLSVCICARSDVRWEKIARVVEACTSAGVYNIRFKKMMTTELRASQRNGAAMPAP